MYTKMNVITIKEWGNWWLSVKTWYKLLLYLFGKFRKGTGCFQWDKLVFFVASNLLRGSTLVFVSDGSISITSTLFIEYFLVLVSGNKNRQ